jgi:hypothetical protein
MKILSIALLLIFAALSQAERIPYYHVPEWFDTKLTGKCSDYEGATFCYMASTDTSGRKMIGIGYQQYFHAEFDSLFKVWNDTGIYYLGIEDFVR